MTTDFKICQYILYLRNLLKLNVLLDRFMKGHISIRPFLYQKIPGQDFL